jgi:hypothetical protein
MPTDSRRIPRSYDEIVRRTVPDPDSSWRPDERQIEEADEQHRHQRLSAQMTDQEHILYGRVAEVVFANPRDEVGFEVDGDTVILHGSVPDTDALRRLEDRVAATEGVERVVSRIVIRP